MIKKIPMLVTAIAVFAIAGYSAVAQAALPEGCHYHSDGRVHCIFQPASGTVQR